jgi:hypothetical protein
MRAYVRTSKGLGTNLKGTTGFVSAEIDASASSKAVVVVAVAVVVVVENLTRGWVLAAALARFLWDDDKRGAENADACLATMRLELATRIPNIML